MFHSNIHVLIHIKGGKNQRLLVSNSDLQRKWSRSWPKSSKAALPGYFNESRLGICELLFFSIFFPRHFLQQYRRHRIHSFTNTKHTTTLVAAAVKKRTGGSGGGAAAGSGGCRLNPAGLTWTCPSLSPLHYYFFYPAIHLMEEWQRLPFQTHDNWKSLDWSMTWGLTGGGGLLWHT